MFIYIECIILIFIEKYWIDKKKSSPICKVNNDLLNRYNFVLASFLWKSFEVKKVEDSISCTQNLLVDVKYMYKVETLQSLVYFINWIFVIVYVFNLSKTLPFLIIYFEWKYIGKVIELTIWSALSNLYVIIINHLQIWE